MEVEEWDVEAETCRWASEVRRKPWVAGYGRRNCDVADVVTHVGAGEILLGHEMAGPPPHHRHRHHRLPCF